MILLFLLLTNPLFMETKLNYNPNICTITNYDFTFLFDKETQQFKIHGIWPEQCQECINCGYPSCCNINNINYMYPNDTTNFIKNYWYNTITTEECTGKKNVILFEHEFYKHISCTNLKTTNEFLELVIFLYNAYYEQYVYNKCVGYTQLWLNLDSNFMHNNKTICL